MHSKSMRLRPYTVGDQHGLNAPPRCNRKLENALTTP